MNWFNPLPFDAPIRYPRQVPKTVVPSFIGDAGQVLNLLTHHGAGGVVRDYSGFNNHGTILGPDWVDGSYGWALDYNGATGGDYVNVPSSASLNLTGALTIEAWVNPRVLLGKNRIILWKFGAYDLYVTVGGILIGEVYDGAYHTVTSATALLIGNYYYVSFTFDNSLVIDNLKLYINGVLDGAPTNFLGTANIVINSVMIGGNPSVGDAYFAGLIPRLLVYNRALTQPVISRHFESTRAIFGI